MRILVFSLIDIVGGVYGYVSALQNRNPYRIAREREMSPSEAAKIPLGKAWRPSPAWLPSYLICTVPKKTVTAKVPKGMESSNIRETTVVGIGLKNVNGRGYAFANSMYRSTYNIWSLAVGAIMGLLVAAVVSVAAGWVTLRKHRPE